MKKIKWVLLLPVMLLLCGCQKDGDEKKIVTLDIGEPSPQMQAAIDRFNAGNDTYCVEVVDNTGVTDVISVRAVKLTAGDGPDIFVAGADTHFQEYVEKGVLEDLKPYIEADLKEEEYLTELLYAYERDGKVYAIETEFQIIGMIGAKEIFGDMEGWTPQEAIAMMEAHPNQIRIFTGMHSEIM
ncbi:MAG: extracellular solute-binding protein [Lachnospiraceae bacterium]|nr:extracellular solute-binding protein [Lachnospiraceae bacterium]